MEYDSARDFVESSVRNNIDLYSNQEPRRKRTGGNGI